MTPREAINKFCLECVGFDRKELKSCGGDFLLVTGKPCPLYPVLKRKTRYIVKAIWQHCLYCMNGQRDFVRECTSKDCFLWLFRMGKNPNITRKTRLILSQKIPSQTALQAQISTQAKKT